VQSIIEGLDIAATPKPLPLRRIQVEAQHHPIVIAAIIRTAAREESYQWIGQLCEDAFVMASRAPTPAVGGLEEARGLKSIAVAAGGANESLLREHGFTNLDPASSIELEVRRLVEGHDDAWFAPRSGVIHAWVAAGYDPSLLRFSPPIAPMPVWMAASLSVPAPLVETLRARLADKQKQGALGCGPTAR
jgi:hypothetical protein